MSHSSLHHSPSGLLGMSPICFQSQIFWRLASQVSVLKDGVSSAQTLLSLGLQALHSLSIVDHYAGGEVYSQILSQPFLPSLIALYEGVPLPVFSFFWFLVFFPRSSVCPWKEVRSGSCYITILNQNSPNCTIEIILLSSLLPKLHQLAVFFLILQGLYQVKTPLKIILRCMGLFLVHVLTSAIAFAINCIVL